VAGNLKTGGKIVKYFEATDHGAGPEAQVHEQGGGHFEKQRVNPGN
jgi:hypothetical protein